jgi:protease-4
MQSSPPENPKNETLTPILEGFLKEYRRNRRAKFFFRLIILIILICVCLSLCTQSDDNALDAKKPHVALITLNGEIGEGASITADKTITALDNAFGDSGTKAVILRINSPGGSPVQSDEIYEEIMRLRALHPQVPVYAVCIDMCNSGAYYIASSATAIYANPASMVGSIGVIMSGFEADKAIEKLGIKRRVFIAGDRKDLLDPFMPMTPADQKAIQTMLNIVHTQFIAAVKKGRGTRLKQNPDMFSGLLWTGAQAKDLGLIDGFGSVNSVARDVVHEEKQIDYTVKSSFFDRLSNNIGTAMGRAILSETQTHLQE